MNKAGHPQTLVPSHPGNQNAVKAGVFSPAALAPRARELEAALAAQPHAQLPADVLIHELAGLLVLEEAMDRSLEEDGLRGRGGEPKKLVTLRLRLNDKMLRTVELLRSVSPDQDKSAADSREDSPGGDQGAEEPDDEETIPPAEFQSLATTIAVAQRQAAIEDVVPQEVDAEYFLRAVIVTTDPNVTTAEKARAARMLERVRKHRPASCQCFAGWRARDEIEFRSWIDSIRDLGLEPRRDDDTLAALVRRIVQGERLEPWARYRRTEAAIANVLAAAVDNAEKERQTSGLDWIDDEAEPFWRIALSPDPEVGAGERLTALAALGDMNALRQCTCQRRPERLLPEENLDWDRAETIGLLAGRHYRAVPEVLLYPQTYLAIRDAIDSKLLGLSDEGGTPPAGT